MPLKIVTGILIVAALATLADWVWYTFDVCQGIAPGVIHGAVLLTAVGGAIGAASGRLLRGLPIGTLAGTGGALAYYAIVAAFGERTEGAAIPAAWVVTWLSMAVLEGRWISPTARSWLAIAGRGTAAAVLSGIAFYLVLEQLWGAPPPSGRNYALQFAAWAAAWAPGMLALTLRPGRKA
jgi:hypothetical protein